MNRPNTGRSMGPGASQSSWKEQYHLLEKKRTLEDVLQELNLEKSKTRDLEVLLDKACKEIKRYQDRFGLYHAVLQEEEDEAPPVRNFTLAAIQPLLLAYEDNISELRNTLNLQSKEIYDLEVKAEKYVQENHSLRNELEKKCQQIINIYNDGQPEVANVYNRVLKEDQNEKVRLLIDENHELIKNYKELQGQFREVMGTDQKL